MPTQELIDDEDWVEIERAVRSSDPLADVTVKVTVAGIGRGPRTPKARAYLAFRGKAAEWLVVNGSRFRIAVGGAKANYLRIVPDIHHGKFEHGESARGGTKRLNLGRVSAWPNEERPATEAKWSVEKCYMTLVLPETFAVPTAKASPTPDKFPPARAAVAGGVSDYGLRPPVRSTAVATLAGDPAPGRSALDRKRA